MMMKEISEVEALKGEVKFLKERVASLIKTNDWMRDKYKASAMKWRYKCEAAQRQLALGQPYVIGKRYEFSEYGDTGWYESVFAGTSVGVMYQDGNGNYTYEIREIGDK